MKYWRSLQIERVNLSIASQKTAGDQRRKCDALVRGGRTRGLSPNQRRFARRACFQRTILLRLNELTGAAATSKMSDVLPRISQGAVRVNVIGLRSSNMNP